MQGFQYCSGISLIFNERGYISYSFYKTFPLTKPLLPITLLTKIPLVLNKSFVILFRRFPAFDTFFHFLFFNNILNLVPLENIYNFLHIFYKCYTSNISSFLLILPLHPLPTIKALQFCALPLIESLLDPLRPALGALHLFRHLPRPQLLPIVPVLLAEYRIVLPLPVAALPGTFVV